MVPFYNYVRKFKEANLLDGSYDCKKLKFLIDFLIDSWVNKTIA